MEEELDLDLDEGQNEEINREKTRNKGLSEKVILTAKERDEAKALAEKVEAEKQQALKDVDFYKNFSTVSSKYAGSAEYQDQIKEKVNAGYDLEDATISILAKEGKYTPQAPVVAKESPVGGSATNTIKSGEKPVSDMTQDERLAQLVEAEKRGDIALS